MNQTLRTIIITLVLAVWTATPAYAGPFDEIYVFGDSLSDVGNDLIITGGIVPASPPYYQGRFANGPNYADVLANGLGLTLSPSEAGGNDYAYGGVRSNYVRPELIPFGALSFVEQIDEYKNTANVADPNALYVLWIGSNDIADILTGSNPNGGAGAGAAITQTLTDLGNSIVELAVMGAEHFLIPNVPNLGLTPNALKFGVSGIATGLAQLYNGNLNNMLDNLNQQLLSLGLSPDLLRFDAFSAHTAIFNNPADYGLTNVTDACYLGLENGTPPGAPICATPASYLSWDYQHPSATTHAILGTQMLQFVVPEPGAWALFITGLVLMVWQVGGRRQTIV